VALYGREDADALLPTVVTAGAIAAHVPDGGVRQLKVSCQAPRFAPVARLTREKLDQMHLHATVSPDKASSHVDLISIDQSSDHCDTISLYRCTQSRAVERAYKRLKFRNHALVLPLLRNRKEETQQAAAVTFLDRRASSAIHLPRRHVVATFLRVIESKDICVVALASARLDVSSKSSSNSINCV